MVKYRDCVAAAARFLGMDGLADITENMTEQSADENDKKEIDILLSCLRFVLHEIASEYVPLVSCETVDSCSGYVLYTSLKKPVTDVVCVRRGGVKEKFRLLHDRIELLSGGRNGNVTVEYSYAPKTGGMDDLLEWTGDRISARAAGYGTACEYCIINGMSEAVLWDKRYKDALAAVKRTGAELKVKKRAWI